MLTASVSKNGQPWVAASYVVICDRKTIIMDCRTLSKHDGKFSTHSAIIHADLLYYNTQKTLATQAVDDVRGVMLGFGVQSGRSAIPGVGLR
jgi:hypothetical protein